MIVLSDVQCRICKKLYDVTLEHRLYTICQTCHKNQKAHNELVEFLNELDKVTSEPDEN